MGVKKKFNGEMFAVLMGQYIFLLLALVMDNSEILSKHLNVILLILFYYGIMHFLFTTVLGIQNIRRYLWLYVMTLQFFNIIILKAYNQEITLFLTTIFIGVCVGVYTKRNIEKMIDLKKYDDNKSIHYFVILAGMLLGTYMPLLGISIAYIIVSMLPIYVHDKFVYLSDNPKDE